MIFEQPTTASRSSDSCSFDKKSLDCSAKKSKLSGLTCMFTKQGGYKEESNYMCKTEHVEGEKAEQPVAESSHCMEKKDIERSPPLKFLCPKPAKNPISNFHKPFRHTPPPHDLYIPVDEEEDEDCEEIDDVDIYDDDMENDESDNEFNENDTNDGHETN